MDQKYPTKQTDQEIHCDQLRREAEWLVGRTITILNQGNIPVKEYILSKNLKGMRETTMWMNTCGKSIVGRGNRRCEEPEVRTWLVSLGTGRRPVCWIRTGSGSHSLVFSARPQVSYACMCYYHSISLISLIHTSHS